MSRAKLNTQIYEEACEWFVEFRGGDLDGAARREFDLWVRKSPEHLSAYLEVAAIWNEGPALDPQQKWDADTLIAQAARDPGNVVTLAPPTPSSRRTPGSSQTRFLWAASVAIACVGAALLMWSTRDPRYATGIGEQRSLTLADGSTVELNSRSKIKIRYSARARDIELLEGQALFRVEKDPTRPFIVGSGATRVRAVGTQFDVYRKSTGTVVTVVEGRVAIVGGEQKLSLGAGEQLTATPRALKKAAHPNVVTATAWTQRQLVFDSASLAEVAEEFNRYNERQLVIDETAPYDFHISGVFSSTEPASLIRFLRERPGVRVIETAGEIRVVKNIS